MPGERAALGLDERRRVCSTAHRLPDGRATTIAVRKGQTPLEKSVLNAIAVTWSFSGGSADPHGCCRGTSGRRRKVGHYRSCP
jgi:hypothetical protein